ncbi:unnamed protein product [Linum tenue]|uniref:Protein GAMETE EXPRESSED 3 n=1 Tax=Linum tenue TaxID=586396 RepID=A0AAV0MY79_9ROSI|nr:unnamed protein product [Linum tenue]
MPLQSILFFLPVLQLLSAQPYPAFPGQGSWTARTAPRRLSKPLIGDDGTIYTCSQRFLLAFQSNGSLAWTLHLAYECNLRMAPVHGGPGLASPNFTPFMFLVADDRVLKINVKHIGTSVPAEEVFFGQKGGGEIIGVAVSTLSSTVFINVENRGLFACDMNGKLVWSAGPLLSQSGYRLGCRRGIKDCYFASVPVIDQCEASLFISNTKGEVYSLSLRDPRFNWVQDLSFLDTVFTITPGNNGRLYVTVPAKALVLALDVYMGSILWKQGIGPLPTEDTTPVVDSNGWISLGSLDGFLYSISPAGVVKKFMKASKSSSVIQVSPVVDCSGYGVYISQTHMEGKVDRVIGEYNYVSAIRPTGVTFTLLVPATGTVYWSESYPGRHRSFKKNISAVNSLGVSFLAVPNVAPLSKNFVQVCIFSTSINYSNCFSISVNIFLDCPLVEKLVSTCSQANPKHIVDYPGNRRTLLLFLLFETIVLLILAGLVRFCCIFWNKEKLQGQGLGSFLGKRRSLQRRKKALERTITELQGRAAAAEEVTGHQTIEEIGNLLRKRGKLERKLSTTYSLGRDESGRIATSSPGTLLPTYNNGAGRSYSFQSAKKENVTIFDAAGSHDTSSSSSAEAERSSSEGEEEDSSWTTEEEQHYCQETSAIKEKGKGIADSEAAESSSDDGVEVMGKYQRWLSEPGSGSTQGSGTKSMSLKRRKTPSSFS